MRDFAESTYKGEEAALAASHPSAAEEDAVISSFLISTVEGKTADVAEAVSLIAGVEVHEAHDTTLVITIEAPTIDASTKIASEVHLTKGVMSQRMVYANFEDDPLIKAQLQAQRNKETEG